MKIEIINGHCLTVLRKMPQGSVHCIVTSPPYFGLRDYKVPSSIWGGKPDCKHKFGPPIAGSNRGGSGTPTNKNNRGENYARGNERGNFCQHCDAWRGVLGLEPSVEMYVAHLTKIFRECSRVLRDDGTLWLNLGDSYAGSGSGKGDREPDKKYKSMGLMPVPGMARAFRPGSGRADGIIDERGQRNRDGVSVPGIVGKNLIGIPWRVAFALQADGWILRNDIIWSKPNPMPESVTDRCTNSHEYIFLFSKRQRYYFDADAVAEKASDYDGLTWDDRKKLGEGNRRGYSQNGRSGLTCKDGKRNKRDVWTVNSHPFKQAHFATFPPKLIVPCIKAGCPFKGTVLDPFGGAGTVGLVSEALKRNAILIELSPQFSKMARDRIHDLFTNIKMTDTE